MFAKLRRNGVSDQFADTIQSRREPIGLFFAGEFSEFHNDELIGFDTAIGIVVFEVVGEVVFVPFEREVPTVEPFPTFGESCGSVVVRIAYGSTGATRMFG